MLKSLKAAHRHRYPVIVCVECIGMANNREIIALFEEDSLHFVRLLSFMVMVDRGYYMPLQAGCQ
jgi:hypothetical protein